MKAFEEATEGPEAKLVSRAQLEALHALKKASTEVASPLQRLEHGVHPWATFLILPLFALANAGVAVDHGVVSSLGGRLGLGVILGLVLGKHLGITLFAWLACRLGLAALPSTLDWRHIHGAAWLGGVGFTMSLFIGGLAFGEGEMLAGAKLAVLVASLVAGIGGYLYLRRAATRPPTGQELNEGRLANSDGMSA